MPTHFRSKIKPVASVTATSNTDNASIVVSWPTPTASGQPTGGFVLYRNGSQIASLGPTVRTYTDTSVVRATTYSYEVSVVSTGTQQSVQAASNNVRLPSQSGANIITAASASLADVQAAVNSAVDGDTVVIPNGTVSWTGGITTTKQIIIRAQNYTPTPLGTMTRSVTITNNSGSTPLFSFTTGNSYSCGVIGIRFNNGSGTGVSNYVRFSGSGTKPPLIGDCGFEFPHKNGSNPGNAFIAMTSLGGVIWNTYFLGMTNVQTDLGGLGICVESPRAWTTASTMGMLDTSGNVNVYLESCTALNLSTFLDIDAQGRAVIRNCVIDGSYFLIHGFTSGGQYGGGRHAEIYDNTLRSTTTLRNMAGRYFWLRMGTVLFTGNSIADASDLSYGHIDALIIGDNMTAPYGDGHSMPGWGHDGVADQLDPIYLWSNTGAQSAACSFSDSSWASATTVATTPGQANGELFVNLGAKPGWTRYTYPHPARPY